MSPPLLTLQNIHLTFGVTPLLDGADLQVAEGERLCLVGRNGSGKSTLMKVAAGLVEADDGERFIHPGATIRYLEQEPDLAGFETLRDYVVAGLAPGDMDYRADYLMEQLGLTGQEDPAKVSGGEARRAALARALVNLTANPVAWMSAGYEDGGVALVTGSDIYAPVAMDDAVTALRYAPRDELLAGGYLWDEFADQLAYKPYLLSNSYGSGQVVAFTQSPTTRAYLEGLDLLLLNAVILGPARSRTYRY